MRAFCIECLRPPEQIREYIREAAYLDIPVEQYVRENEGSYNPDNGHFLCTECYVKRGAPSSPEGWIAP